MNSKARTTLFLCTVFGLFGAHYFYNRRYFMGLVMLFTLGGFGIIWMADIRKLESGRFYDNKGKYLEAVEKSFGNLMLISWALLTVVISVSVNSVDHRAVKIKNVAFECEYIRSSSGFGISSKELEDFYNDRGYFREEEGYVKEVEPGVTSRVYINEYTDFDEPVGCIYTTIIRKDEYDGFYVNVSEFGSLTRILLKEDDRYSDIIYAYNIDRKHSISPYVYDEDDKEIFISADSEQHGYLSYEEFMEIYDLHFQIKEDLYGPIQEEMYGIK